MHNGAGDVLPPHIIQCHNHCSVVLQLITAQPVMLAVAIAAGNGPSIV